MTTRADSFEYVFECCFPFDSPKAAAAAEEVVELLHRLGQAADPCLLYDLTVRSHEITSLVATSRRSTFNITFPSSAAHLGRVRNYDHAFLHLDFQDVSDWGAVATTCCGLGSVIFARVADSAYDYWQNAYDPLQFQAAGRSMEGLPMRSNNLPPPLDQMIVDISTNPGRRILRNGYVEAIGHRMWLGQEFFRRVPGVSLESFVSAPWLKVTKRQHETYEVVASEEPFVDASTTDVQIRLRRLLFPTTADSP